MSRKKKYLNNDEGSDGPAEWLTTYSDLVTLLLTFFIMLFSMGSIDEEKFGEVTSSIRNSFGYISSGNIFNANQGKDYLNITDNNTNMNDGTAQEDNPDSVVTVEDAKGQLKDEIAELGLEENVTVIENKDFLMLRIDSAILFDLGSAAIKKDGKETLLNLSGVLGKLENDIIVQGHTDTLPINTLLFPTNWELSTKRATNVVLFLIDECNLDPTRLTATGNGEFRPIRPNDTEENRAKNRRIDIEIVK